MLKKNVEFQNVQKYFIKITPLSKWPKELMHLAAKFYRFPTIYKISTFFFSKFHQGTSRRMHAQAALPSVAMACWVSTSRYFSFCFPIFARVHIWNVFVFLPTAPFCIFGAVCGGFCTDICSREKSSAARSHRPDGLAREVCCGEKPELATVEEIAYTRLSTKCFQLKERKL